MNAFLPECKLRFANSTSPKRALRVLFPVFLSGQQLNLAAVKSRCKVSKCYLQVLVVNTHKKRFHDAAHVQQPNGLMSKFSVRKREVPS